MQRETSTGFNEDEDVMIPWRKWGHYLETIALPRVGIIGIADGEVSTMHSLTSEPV
jgi:hypothetical protein